jgi:hypothetical protein
MLLTHLVLSLRDLKIRQNLKRYSVAHVPEEYKFLNLEFYKDEDDEDFSGVEIDGKIEWVD